MIYQTKSLPRNQILLLPNVNKSRNKNAQRKPSVHISWRRFIKSNYKLQNQLQNQQNFIRRSHNSSLRFHSSSLMLSFPRELTAGLQFPRQKIRNPTSQQISGKIWKIKTTESTEGHHGRCVGGGWVDGGGWPDRSQSRADYKPHQRQI